MTGRLQNSSPIEFAHFNSLQLDVQRPPPSKSPFLFVVKTPDSDILSRSTTRSAAASINSHAQRWVQESSSSKTHQPLQAIAPSRNSSLRFEKCVTRCRVDRLGSTDSKISKPRRYTGRRAAQKLSKTSKAITETHPTVLKPIELNELKVSHTQSTEHERELPIKTLSFSATPSITPVRCPSLPLDDSVQSVLQYYLSFVLLSTSDNEGTILSNDQLVHHSSTIRDIVQGCMRETVHMYALLAATASRMKRVSGIHFRADSGPESYLSKAIRGLRALLNSETAATDRQLILDIYYLSVCEWYLGSYGAANTHFNFLKYFWQSLTPGASSFDQYVYDMLCYNASSLSHIIEDNSSQAASSPTASSTSWSPHQSPSRQPEINFDSSCSGLTSALESTMYSEDLKDVVQNLLPIAKLFRKVAWGAKGEVVWKPEMMFLCSESQKFIHRLLELPSYGSELCCRLALVLVLRLISQATAATTGNLFPTTSEPTETILSVQRLRRQLQYEILLPANEISRGNLSRSQSQLSAYTASLSASNRSVIWTGSSDQLLLWILVTGLFTAKQCRLNDETHWFGTRATALASVLGVRTQECLRDLMLSFFSIDDMLSNELCDEILVLGDDEQ